MPLGSSSAIREHGCRLLGATREKTVSHMWTTMTAMHWITSDMVCSLGSFPRTSSTWACTCRISPGFHSPISMTPEIQGRGCSSWAPKTTSHHPYMPDMLPKHQANCTTTYPKTSSCFSPLKDQPNYRNLPSRTGHL